MPCYEGAFRRWFWALEFHHRLLGQEYGMENLPSVPEFSQFKRPRMERAALCLAQLSAEVLRFAQDDKLW